MARDAVRVLPTSVLRLPHVEIVGTLISAHDDLRACLSLYIPSLSYFEYPLNLLTEYNLVTTPLLAPNFSLAPPPRQRHRHTTHTRAHNHNHSPRVQYRPGIATETTLAPMASPIHQETGGKNGNVSCYTPITPRETSYAWSSKPRKKPQSSMRP